jgi:quinol monooxygenase YgiN
MATEIIGGAQMSTHVVTEFTTQTGAAGNLIALLTKVLHETLEHSTCKAIDLRRDQDEPNHVVSFTEWATRQDYVDYFSWRTDTGLTAEVNELLAEPISITYFDEILSRNTDETWPLGK